MEDSVPVRIGMGGKAKSGRRKIKSVSNKPATMSTKKYTPDDQEWPSDLPEHFVDIGKDWRNTPFIIRPAAYQGLLDLCWAVCINRSVESAFNLLDDGREPVRLSAQHLVNGVHKHESGHITHFDGVRDFMKRHGMVPEASCPWTGKNQPILAVMQYCTGLEDHREGIYDGPGRSTSNTKQSNEANQQKGRQVPIR
ncbi:BnaC05g11990D [Brassica napus]|uniref:BnaC05g11990D protein n=1 Tax=Brassica napus TaxID=3708 RepID=A0A078H7B6_BRANA|nr:BnaC05g11990D [Brassica napus]